VKSDCDAKVSSTEDRSATLFWRKLEADGYQRVGFLKGKYLLLLKNFFFNNTYTFTVNFVSI
jgi:hypothetical protein